MKRNVSSLLLADGLMTLNFPGGLAPEVWNLAYAILPLTQVNIPKYSGSDAIFGLRDKNEVVVLFRYPTETVERRFAVDVKDINNGASYANTAALAAAITAATPPPGIQGATEKVVFLSGTPNTSGSAYVDITGMGIPVTAGEYEWDFSCDFTSTGMDGGLGLSVNGPALVGSDFVTGRAIIRQNSATPVFADINGWDNASTGAGSTPGVAPLRYPASMSGTFKITNSGTFMPRFRRHNVTQTITITSATLTLRKKA